MLKRPLIGGTPPLLAILPQLRCVPRSLNEIR
jgi:hypothetical protein